MIMSSALARAPQQEDMMATSARTARTRPGWMFALGGLKTFVETGAPLVGAR
ncbi:hypothetical protein I6A84_30380 [Frankia sp. CNm7]|uniref:Uncharacterized protein n=1 Tax=Frankia nepalensis TaxID=1836974 RepID=A0A937RAS9_9ACTN|nr:hypothetical protein [Frankia nepalensis]MBL7500835.1 hypothetical protein [Frankia nepalensis]MBL7515316.1 hypothetical protein [Frankia nepalensis]MBL7522271.1 hypothetical protein [Frankia nepalensis]MBL7627035.1 hypothetical protein [Frankia nepalensis]